MSRCRHIPGRLFPFPVPHIDTPPNDRIGVPLEVAVKWYWRVRNWTIGFGAVGSFSYDYYNYDGNGGHYTTLINGGASDVYGRPGEPYVGAGYATIQDSEPNLSVPLLWNKSYPVGAPDQSLDGGVYLTDPPPPASEREKPLLAAYVDVHLFGVNFPDPAYPALQYCPANGLYYPALHLYGYVGSNYSLAQISYSPVPIRVHPTDYMPGPQCPVDMTITIDGYSVTLPQAAVFEAQPGPYHVVFDEYRSCAFSLTPREFWVYEGRWPQDNDPTNSSEVDRAFLENVPLYDSGEGEPALNPVTGVQFTVAEIAAAPFP